MADLADKIIGWIAAIGVVSLLTLNAWEFGRDLGKREAIASFQCPKGTMYQIVRHDTGETKCILPRTRT